MSCELPLGHSELLLGLWRAAREKRLAHFLLFSGPPGIGKWLAARALAQGLLCARGPGPPCGACGPCKRVESGGHPDLLVLDPVAAGEERIPIDWIVQRDDSPPEWLERFLSLKAAEGGWRIVLLREAERLCHGEDVAQNALLKTLEEPAPGTLLVLESSRPDLFLPTIRSRRVRARLAAPGIVATRDWLIARGVDAGEAAELARWSGGAPGAALLLRERSAARVRELLLALLAGQARPAEVARELWELEPELPGKTPKARERARAGFILEILAELGSDALRLANGLPSEALRHGAAAAVLRGSDLARSPARAAQALEALARARQDIRHNLEPAALLERALAALSPRRPSLRSSHAGRDT